MRFLSRIACVLFACVSVWGNVLATDVIPEFKAPKFKEMMNKVELVKSEFSPQELRILSSGGTLSSTEQVSNPGEERERRIKFEALSYLVEMRKTKIPSPFKINECFVVTSPSPGFTKVTGVVWVHCEDFDPVITLYVLKDPNNKISLPRLRSLTGENIGQVESSAQVGAPTLTFDQAKELAKVFSGCFRFQKDGGTAVVRQLTVYPFEQIGGTNQLYFMGCSPKNEFFHTGFAYEGGVKAEHDERLANLYQSMSDLFYYRLGFKKIILGPWACGQFALKRLTQTDPKVFKEAFEKGPEGTYFLDKLES